MIDRILDNYYTKQLIMYIKNTILIRYFLDIKAEYTKNTVTIYVKPKHYKNYTKLSIFNKREAFVYLISLRCDNGDYILSKIEYFDKENAWNKKGDK